MDEDVIPARGQTVLVRNEVDGMYASSRTEDGEDEMFYVMQRAAGVSFCPLHNSSLLSFPNLSSPQHDVSSPKARQLLKPPPQAAAPSSAAVTNSTLGTLSQTPTSPSAS